MVTTVSYGPNSANKADIYTPNGGTVAPTVLLIHGGGWIRGRRTDALVVEAANQLAAAGIRAVSIDYRLAPSVTWPAIMEDIRLAASWARTYFGGNSTALWAWGYSAGGHLGMWLAIEGLVDKAISVSGPADLTKLNNNYVPAICPTTACRVAASPALNVVVGTKPVGLWYGTKDTLVPLAQGKQMRDALIAKGTPVSYNEYNGYHTLSGLYSSDRTKVRSAMIAWLKT